MITPVDNLICGPLNLKKDINNLLLKNIDYSSETLPNGFISRNVNIVVNKNDKPTFSQIINDCQKRETYEGDKYKQIILDTNEFDEDENDETIEKMIASMENKIKSIDTKILNTYKNTILLDNSLPETYSKNTTFIKQDQEMLQRLNTFLEEFAKNKYTKDNL
jgi:hypothetical protein